MMRKSREEDEGETEELDPKDEADEVNLCTTSQLQPAGSECLGKTGV